jgi:hypothetical protein
MEREFANFLRRIAYALASTPERRVEAAGTL